MKETKQEKAQRQKEWKIKKRVKTECLSFSLMSRLLGGPAVPEGSNRHRHAGRHLEGDVEVLLRHHLQAGGQHKWRRLDDVSSRQKPQGKPGREVFHLRSRNPQVSRVRAGGAARLYNDNQMARESRARTLYCWELKQKERLGALLKAEVWLLNRYLCMNE